MGPVRSFRPPGALPADPLAPYTGPWGRRQAAHLLRRAGFGASEARVSEIAAMSMREAVDEMLVPQSALPPEPHYSADPYDLPYPPGATRAQVDEIKQQRTLLYYKAASVIQLWWLQEMLDTPSPLREKMTLFWHGHFTTAMGNKGVRPKDVVRQNQLYRRYALGNIRDLTQAVSRDAGMLKYLDNVYSRKEHPNENYARELMELFTLGIGSYTERDVRESARAFTGWTIDWSNDTFHESSQEHDTGKKQFLGREGNFDGNDIVNILFEQPAASRWYARKLLNFFVYNDPEPELITSVSALLVKNDFELAPVMSVLLRSHVFHSERAYRALVKSPVEFVIGSYHLCGVRHASFATLDSLDRMGQVLFLPPSVKGWDGGLSWLNSQALLARENFLHTLFGSAESASDHLAFATDMPMNAREAAGALAERILQSDISPTAAAELTAYLDGAGASSPHPLSSENFERRMRDAAYLAAATPSYHLA